MSVTIVIVNWNGGEMLLRCLESIRNSQCAFAVKVIVVDNNSGDGSRELAEREYPEFQVMNSGGNIGFGRANNLVRPMVGTPLVLILNPDTELKQDTLERCVQCLQGKPDVGALGCKMLYPTGEVQEQGLQWFPSPWTIFLELVVGNRAGRRWFRRWLPVFDPRQSTYARKLYGGFILARKEVLDRAGWFDDRYFMYAEDVDLCRTITDSGWKLYYCSEAEIIHVAGGTSAKAPGGFSILMKNESINKLMHKYHGVAGAMMHRVVVFGGAGVRVLALIPLELISRFRAGRRSSEGVFLKEKLMLLWALGLRKPFIVNPR